MTRLFVLTFHGPERWTDDIKHPHESPAIMTIPLILLAVGSVFSGWLLSTSVKDWLVPLYGRDHPEPARHLNEVLMSVIGVVVVLIGAGLSWALFRRGTALEEQPAGAVVTA